MCNCLQPKATEHDSVKGTYQGSLPGGVLAQTDLQGRIRAINTLHGIGEFWLCRRFVSVIASVRLRSAHLARQLR